MEITTKGRYAVRVMAQLSKTSKYISISEIAKEQNISVKYLEKIIALLHKSNLVKSLKGTNGGYTLSRKPSEITIKEILDVTENKIEIAPCVNNKNCPNLQKCETMAIWEKLNNMIDEFLRNITLENLLK